MNELDDFKKAWDSVTQASTFKQYSTKELQKIVKKRSRNELLKIQRKLLVECLLTFIIAVVMVVVIHFINSDDQIYTLVFVLILFTLSFIPYYKVLRLRYVQHNNLKTHLENYITSLEKLIKQYVRMSTILIPVAFLGGLLLGFHSALAFDAWNQLLRTPTIIICSIVFVLVSLLGNWVQKQYFNLVYGKNIRRLKLCLEELNQVEE